jgi:hypothetical protein
MTPAATNRLELLAAHEALEELAQEYPIHAGVVKLRYFAGMTIEETSQAPGMTISVAKRYGTFSRAWLLNEIGGE